MLVEHQTFHCIYEIWLAINLNLAQAILFVLIAAANNLYDIEPDNIPDKINYLFILVLVGLLYHFPERVVS